VSDQSSVIESRELLEKKYEDLDKKYENEDVPLPDFWGGYRLAPVSFEFWQSRENRLHDRILYLKVSGKWKIMRLAP
jgi:pyridoxamine 5'-phosphate oxidase